MMSNFKINLTNIGLAQNNEKKYLVHKLKKLSPKLFNSKIYAEYEIGINKIAIPIWYHDMVNHILDKFDLDSKPHFNITEPELKVLTFFTISLMLSSCGNNMCDMLATEIQPNSMDSLILVYMSGYYGISDNIKQIYYDFLIDIKKNVFSNFYIPRTIGEFVRNIKYDIKYYIPNPVHELVENNKNESCWNNDLSDIYLNNFQDNYYFDSDKYNKYVQSILDLLPNNYNLNMGRGDEDIPQNIIILPPTVDYNYKQQKLKNDIEYKAYIMHIDDHTKSSHENWYNAEKSVLLEREFRSTEERYNDEPWKDRYKTKKRSKMLHLEDTSRTAEDNWYLAERQLKDEYIKSHNSYFIKAMSLIKKSYGKHCYSDIKDKTQFNAGLSYLKILSDDGNYIASIELAKYYYFNTYCMIEFGMSYKYFFRALKQGYWVANQTWSKFIEKNMNYSIKDF